MSPNIPPAFEHLPAEIHGNILRQMASPEDVYSTIQASTKALRSFLCFREDILIQVLQAHLPSEIFAEYLGLLHIPKYEDFNHVPNQSELTGVPWDDGPIGTDWEWEHCKYRAWAALVNRFLKTHFQNVGAARATDLETYSKPNTSEKADANYLISTYGMLKRFIRSYQLFVRINFANEYRHFDFKFPFREAQLSQDWPALSESETSRLHRGFIRYEICCRLNTISDRNGAALQSKLLGSGLFKPLSTYLEPWEEEEIRCIRAYVFNQYEGVVRDVVKDFACDVWRLSKKARHAPDSEIKLAPYLTPADARSDFMEWKHNMSCLGLPLLQQVLQSGDEDQRRFFKNTNLRCVPPYHRISFLRDNNPVLTPQWHHRANPVYNSIYHALPAFEDGDDDHDFLEWLEWLYDESEEDIQTGLRQTGWVFWEDHSRVNYFALPASLAEREGHHIKHYVATLDHRRFIARMGFGMPGLRTPDLEEMMYVTREGHKELMDNYAAKPVEPEAETFLLGRLRAISDWSSKEVSPAFQEICSATHATE